MWRSYLLAYPFLALYLPLGALVMIPVTWLIRDVRPLYWASQQGIRIALALGGVRLRILNLERAYERPTNVFIANHVSYLEPAALFLVLPRLAVILKKELGRIPFLGPVMKLGSFIFVDRKATDSRRQALEAGVAALNRGVSLLIFPEGTRSRDGRLLPFRPGPFTMAIEAGAALVPIVVRGAREVMPYGGLGFRPGVIELELQAPIDTAGLDLAQRGALMERVRRELAEALGGPAPTAA